MAEEGGKHATRKQQAMAWLNRLSDDEAPTTPVQDEVSAPRFVLYNTSDKSKIQTLPMINQEAGVCSEPAKLPDYYCKEVEAIKNGVWGNTFFFSKRVARLLGPEMAAKFQYKTSNHLQNGGGSAKPATRPQRKSAAENCA